MPGIARMAIVTFVAALAAGTRLVQGQHEAPKHNLALAVSTSEQKSNSTACLTPYVFDKCVQVSKKNGLVVYDKEAPVTLKRCYQFCEPFNTFYFGVHNGDKCWCANSYEINLKGPTVCDTPCAGAPGLRCGGQYATSIYIMGSGKCADDVAPPETKIDNKFLRRAHKTLDPLYKEAKDLFFSRQSVAELNAEDETDHAIAAVDDAVLLMHEDHIAEAAEAVSRGGEFAKKAKAKYAKITSFETRSQTEKSKRAQSKLDKLQKRFPQLQQAVESEMGDEAERIADALRNDLQAAQMDSPPSRVGDAVMLGLYSLKMAKSPGSVLIRGQGAAKQGGAAVGAESPTGTTGGPEFVTETTFRLVDGLSKKEGEATYSFQSVLNPDLYLMHRNLEIVLAPHDEGAIFKDSATFDIVASSGGPGMVQLRSYNFPERFVRYNPTNGALTLAQDDDSTDFEAQSAVLLLGNSKTSMAKWMATPCPEGQVKISFFKDSTPSTEPAMTVCSKRTAFGFNTNNGVPMLGGQKKGFSVRLEQVVTVKGKHRVQINTDGGSRVFVDGAKVIDEWKTKGGLFSSKTINFPGKAKVVMELRELNDKAAGQWKLTEIESCSKGFHVDFYSGTTLLSKHWVGQQCMDKVDLRWDSKHPAPFKELTGDAYSVRARGKVALSEDSKAYQFKAGANTLPTKVLADMNKIIDASASFSSADGEEAQLAAKRSWEKGLAASSEVELFRSPTVVPGNYNVEFEGIVKKADGRLSLEWGVSCGNAPTGLRTQGPADLKQLYMLGEEAAMTCFDGFSSDGKEKGNNTVVAVCQKDGSFKTTDCEPTCPNDCTGHGKCLSSRKCTCDKGWEADDCSKPVCSKGCYHGNCTAPDTCECLPGWKGETCNVATTLEVKGKKCSGTPCVSVAQCTDTRVPVKCWSSPVGNGAHIVGDHCVATASSGDVTAHATCDKKSVGVVASADHLMEGRVVATCPAGSNAISCNCERDNHQVDFCAGKSEFSPSGNECSRDIRTGGGRRRNVGRGSGAVIYAVCESQSLGAFVDAIAFESPQVGIPKDYSKNHRCGTRFGVNDTTSPVCVGATEDGYIEGVKEQWIRARCAADSGCAGYSLVLADPKDPESRPRYFPVTSASEMDLSVTRQTKDTGGRVGPAPSDRWRTWSKVILPAPVATTVDNRHEIKPDNENFGGFKSGISILAKVTMQTVEEDGMVLDVGSGSNGNVFFGNVNKSTDMVVRVTPKSGSDPKTLLIPGAWMEKIPQTYLVSVDDEGRIRVFRDGLLLAEDLRKGFQLDDIRGRKFVGRAGEGHQWGGSIEQVKMWPFAVTWAEATGTAASDNGVGFHQTSWSWPQQLVTGLDQHNLVCPSNQALTAFKMVKSETFEGSRDAAATTDSVNVRFDYSCAAVPGRLAKCHHKETASDLDDKPKYRTWALDKHDVKCDENQVLTQWTLYKPSSSSISLQHTCCDVAGGLQRFKCETMKTGQQLDDGGALTSLVNHPVKCPKENQRLSQFHIRRNALGNKIYAEYTCCYLNEI
mmetsp:Transcript_41447/g.109011  ORF Transcript_41447/g.109011 Transcript_41447/m.109011 type:complete len:1525 (+) Transcript_41447:34-4608(+)